MSKTLYYILDLLIMAGVTYIIRMLPIVIFKKKIKSQFINSLLYYLPYAVLSAMTFPFILSSSESIFPAVYLFLELAEVYFLVLQRPSFFLPSSSVVYLISCRVGNYVQNLRDPLSIVSYACSDNYMPQGLEIISAMCCCRLLIKTGWKKNIIFRCEKPSPLSNNFSCIFPKML